MTPEQRRITEEQVDKFRLALADPMRSIKRIEAGLDPRWIAIEEDAMRSQLADLEAQLKIGT